MKRYACVIVAAVLAVCSCEKTVKIMDVISDDAISALRTTDVEVVGDEIVMISTGTNEMGVSIKYDFDFSGCSTFRFTMTNDSPLSYYFSVALVEKPAPGHTRASMKGRLLNMYSLGAGETRTFEMPIPADIAHQDVDEKFFLMRNFPYSRLTGLYSYNADVSAIKEIKFLFKRCICHLTKCKLCFAHIIFVYLRLF